MREYCLFIKDIPMKNDNVILTLTLAQASVLLTASSVFTRIGTGGIDVLADMAHDEMLPLNMEKLDAGSKFKTGVLTLKSKMQGMISAGFGINHPQVSLTTKRLWSIRNVLKKVQGVDDELHNPEIPELHLHVAMEESSPVVMVSENDWEIKLELSSSQLEAAHRALFVYSNIVAGNVEILSNMLFNHEIPLRSSIPKKVVGKLPTLIKDLTQLTGGVSSSKSGNIDDFTPPLILDITREVEHMIHKVAA